MYFYDTQIRVSMLGTMCHTFQSVLLSCVGEIFRDFGPK